MAQAETPFKQRDTRSGVSCSIDDSLDRRSRLVGEVGRGGVERGAPTERQRLVVCCCVAHRNLSDQHVTNSSPSPELAL